MELDRHNSDVVLIVDDVPDNLSMLHDALDEFGYTVLVATNGEQALQRAAQAEPDVILLDEIEAARPDCTAWLGPLRALAAAFDFDRMTPWIEDALAKTHPA